MVGQHPLASHFTFPVDSIPPGPRGSILVLFFGHPSLGCRCHGDHYICLAWDTLGGAQNHSNRVWHKGWPHYQGYLWGPVVWCLHTRIQVSLIRRWHHLSWGGHSPACTPTACCGECGPWQYSHWLLEKIVVLGRGTLLGSLSGSHAHLGDWLYKLSQASHGLLGQHGH